MKCIVKITLFLFLLTVFIGCKKDDDQKAVNSPGGAVGSLSKALLSDAQYKTLRLDLLFEQSHAPTQEAVDSLEAFLLRRLSKPGGISIKLVEIPTQNQNSFSLDELKNIESSYRNTKNNKGEITAYLFYANGDYSANSNNAQTLGIAYGSSSMVVFGKTIEENTGGLTQPSPALVEQSVMKHEVGHILGLVNLGAPMQTNHQDTEHGKHCINENCLMYWATETGNFISNLTGSSPPQLDANCIADLRANGGA